MKDAKDVIPWKVADLPIRPFGENYWSFNPSLSFDGATWRCVVRCADYCMPSGRTVRSKNARPTGQQTKNAMVILDPDGWKPIQIYKMQENDGVPRASTPHVGFEDMRLFRTDRGGLQGIAASLHLKREQRGVEGMPQHQPPEQVVLSFDDEYNIVSARPIRGGGWSGPEKNWVPFDHCAEPRFLYSIAKGRMFDDQGPVHGDAAIARPSSRVRPVASPLSITPPVIDVAQEKELLLVTGGELSSDKPEAVHATNEEPIHATNEEPRHEDRDRPKRSDRRSKIRGGDVRVARGRRMMLDAGSVRAPRQGSRSTATRRGDESTRVLGTGRVGLPSYEGLRGGTQLVHVGEDAWLGVGHEMKWRDHKKFYWHVFYLVDSRGKMTAASEPMKLAPNGIEFAAGMAIDVDRVVVSFGVDDMYCRIAETQLSAVMETLRAVSR